MSLGNDRDVKDQIKQSTDIVQLIGSYLQLRRQGPHFVAHCPWHDDRRPSLQVHPVRQTWTCWVCDLRGDVFDFVMRREGVDFREALQLLADRLGIPLRSSGPKAQPGSPQDKLTLYKAMAWAAQTYQRALHDASDARLARDYLHDRQFSADALARFQLGFAPLEWSWLLERAKRADISAEVLEACGLISRRDGNAGWSERFRGRLIFPIHDTQGRVIAFGGRLVPGVFPPDQEPPGKYINSPESRLFSKSETLYGLHLAAEAVARTRHLVVVEGYTDVIAAFQAGQRDVVAALGTAINQRHIRLLRRFADRVTLVLDGDAAGQKRTSEVLDLFVAENVDLRITTMPDGLDPFDFFQQQGAAAFQQLIAAAPDALEHRMVLELRGVDLVQDTHRAHQAIERILQTLAQVPISLDSANTSSRVRLDQMLMRLARRFGMNRELMQQRLRELRQQSHTTARTPADSDPATVPVNAAAFAAQELELLQLGLLDAGLLDLAIEQVAPGEFQAGPLRELFDHICSGFHAQQDVSFEGLMLVLDSSELKRVLVWLYEDAIQKYESGTVDTRAQLERVLQAFRLRRVDTEKRQLVNQLEQGELDHEQEVNALAELLNAARRRSGI